MSFKSILKTSYTFVKRYVARYSLIFFQNLRDLLNKKLGYGIQNADNLLKACQETKQLNKNNSIQHGTLSTIESLMQTSNLQARDIMIPRANMVTIDKNATQEELLEAITQNPHSRFPIFSENKEKVVGILITKDVLYAMALKSDEAFNLRRLLRPVKIIPESKRLSFLLKEFRYHRNHMAVVINEFGETTGLITIEDVLEQIVGEILDEYDNNKETHYLQHKLNLFTIKSSLMTIKQLNEDLDLNINLNQIDSNTIGGWLIEHLGYVPQQFEEIVINNLHFRVLKADQNQIRLVELTIFDTESSDDEHSFEPK